MKTNSNSFIGNKNTFDSVDSRADYSRQNMPLGLMSAFCQNPAAMTAFENMDEQKRKRVIDLASKASSKKEMNHLVQNIAVNNLD